MYNTQQTDDPKKRWTTIETSKIRKIKKFQKVPISILAYFGDGITQ